jgi:hypothetical protein
MHEDQFDQIFERVSTPAIRGLRGIGADPLGELDQGSINGVLNQRCARRCAAVVPLACSDELAVELDHVGAGGGVNVGSGICSERMGAAGVSSVPGRAFFMRGPGTMRRREPLPLPVCGCCFHPSCRAGLNVEHQAAPKR